MTGSGGAERPSASVSVSASLLEKPWRLGDACVIVRVRLTPKSSKDAIDGLESSPEGPALKARVRAVPEDGKANSALSRLLAEWLGVPRGAAEVTGGLRSRVKSVTIRGGDTARLQCLLEDRIAVLAAARGGVVLERSRSGKP